MKYLHAFILVAVLLLCVSCSPVEGWNMTELEKSTITIADEPEIVMKPIDEYVAMEAEKLNVEIQNTTDKLYIFEYKPGLEVKYTTEWYIVPLKEEAMWIEIALEAAPNSTTDQSFVLYDFYGTLPAGEYRYVKEFYNESGKVYSAVYFKVK